MVELIESPVHAARGLDRGLRLAISPRNRRITIAVITGAFTIAVANWIAMSQAPGESTFGLGGSGFSGAVLAPLYGGLVTGLIAGFSRRPLHADAKAGTLTAFAGVALLLIWASIARVTGDLPAGGAGFEKFGPISGLMFVLVIGFANSFFSFPAAFVVMFVSRSFVPENKHRYGWVSDDDDNPGVALLTPGPVNQPDLSHASTARSRFRSDEPRYSKIPRRFIDG